MVTQPLICTVCTRREVRAGMVCDIDRTRIARTLDEIVELYATLPEQLAPGQASGEKVSGSREAPLPLRVDPLDLTMPARAAAVSDAHGDQIGHLSVASVLDSWVRDWRDVRGMEEAAPLPTVVTLARWLSVRLEWACDHHEAVDEFATEMFALASTLRRICGTTDIKPELLDAECSRCDQRAMYRLPGEDRVECGGCGRRLTEDEYKRWVGLLSDYLEDQVTSMASVKCKHCGNGIGWVRKSDEAHWTHAGEWQGRRCPGALTGAAPADLKERLSA